MEEFVPEPRTVKIIIHHHFKEYEVWVSQRQAAVMRLVRDNNPDLWYQREWDLFDEALSLLHGVKVLGKYD